MSDNLGLRKVSEKVSGEVERIYQEWDRTWSADDIDAMLALYAPDATLESPLVPYMSGRILGIISGTNEIRALLTKAAPRKPQARGFTRQGYFTDGHLLMWEYPRATSRGEQMDFVEIMEIEDGLIKRHRVYWGWRGVEVLKADAYWNAARD